LIFFFAIAAGFTIITVIQKAIKPADETKKKTPIGFEVANYILVFINFICIPISCKLKKKAVYVGLFAELVRGLIVLFKYKEITSFNDQAEM